MQITHLDITWASFETCNSDKRTAFENMCRWLFNIHFFDGKMILHSDPNNPGVEVLPELQIATNKKISFQAKYFDNSIDYKQIEHSCEKAVEYYEGNLDVIYLYCNKDVTVSCESYQNIANYLAEHNIELIPITNQSILQEVMQNKFVAWYYFNLISLTQEILAEKLTTSLLHLGPRYNSQLNVSTSAEYYLNFFLCNDSAIAAINEEKNKCIQQLQTSSWQFESYKKYSKPIGEKICKLPDITKDTFYQYSQWETWVLDTCKKEFAEIEILISEKKAALENENNQKKQHDLRNEIFALKSLLELPVDIYPNEYVRSLITDQVLIVHGEAGSGKSHLFANAAKLLNDAAAPVILLLGSNYTSDRQITTQTTDILGFGLSFEEVLCKFEGMAIQSQNFAYVFVDAINESAYRNIWKEGLSSILLILSHFPHVKLALSVRDGYESLVFDELITERLTHGSIPKIRHRGFIDESVDATKEFLNFYGIPFLPSYYLQNEMRNPLFLSLFCKTHSREHNNLFSLFDKLIENAEKEALINCDIRDGVSFLQYLLYDIADMFINNNSRIISQESLFSLKFWDTYGLNTKKLPFTASLCKSGLFLSYVSEGVEYYQLGYNLLDDFICAKRIINRYTQEAELQSFLCETFLGIREGKMYKYSNLDASIIVLGLWAEKHKKELFDMIAQNIINENELFDFSQRYLMSFIWRKVTTINKEAFLRFIRSFPVTPEDVFRVLIENASKERHPLNALLLHDILMNKKLPLRDALWTVCINEMANDDERLFQLALHFDEGNTLDGLSKSNTELLLILFVWLFASSNRVLRDKSSKATIELLKNNFDLCLPLLERFEGANDPYILQRLYGVVFGACTKCQALDIEVYKSLAKYVYENIFMQDMVYPDVLLRDYAKLILEKFISAFPKESSFIDIKNITPPYRSEPIPVVSKQTYYLKDADSHGYNNIDFSMRIDHRDAPGMYGDFGRYVFQSALTNFQDIDIVNLYHYAMQFIRDQLGYSDELLGEYDSHGRLCYFRNQTKKIERIGKKYQWIALYNIFARISDHHLLKGWDENPYRFLGTWNPYIRDFDPTLNRNSMQISHAPSVEFPDSSFDFLPIDPLPDKDLIKSWAHKSTSFFSSLPSYLQLKDTNGEEWVALYFYKELKNKEYSFNQTSIGIAENSQIIWIVSEAFFVPNSDLQCIHDHFSSPKFSVKNLPAANDVYQLFNREYVWSSGYQDVFRDSWIDYELESDEYRIETKTCEVPDFEHVVHNEDGSITIPMIEKQFEEKIPISSKFIKVAPAFSTLLWEEQYDASQEETTRFYVPNCDLIKSLELVQKDADGFFYAPNNELVCFDYRLIGGENCFLFRAGYLKQFLQKENLTLCWKCFGEKQYFFGSHDQIWSNWEGLVYLEGNQILGDIKIKEE